MKKIKHRDIYERLWKGRDFEIRHLWQRSIFLATFLALIFTAYFGLWAAVIGMESNTPSIDEQGTVSASGVSLAYMNSIADVKDESILDKLEKNPFISLGFILLSVIGWIFSLLWIFMSKGSKYWYENYERSIDFMHENYALFSQKVKRQLVKEKLSSKIEWRLPHYAPIQGHLQLADYDQHVFSSEGAAYSMSKVNITIGQVFLVLWYLSTCIHIAIFIYFLSKGRLFVTSLVVFIFAVSSFAVVVGFKKHVAGGQYERVFSKSEITGKIKCQKKEDLIKEYYDICKDEIDSNFKGNQFYDYEKQEVDRFDLKKLKYIEKRKLELFLEEFSAADFFPSDVYSEWIDVKTGKRYVFPLDDNDLSNLCSSFLKLNSSDRYRSFADIETLYYDSDKTCLMQDSVIVNIFGEMVGAVEFIYHNVEPYYPYIEYEVIDSECNVLNKGKMQPC